MEKELPARDLGAIIAAELAEIRRIFIKADKVYRCYRRMILQGNDPGKQPPPVEWIPRSDQ